MIIVGDTLLSEDIIGEEFLCNLSACKGACCVEGDVGAPLEESELTEIEDNLEAIMQELPEVNRQCIAENGFFEIDTDGEPVTTCLPDGTCAFAIRNKAGVLSCGMEESHRKGHSGFIKPVSCHLYPIRVSTVGEYTALNYNRWHICSPACEHGQKLGVRVYQFVGPALKRKFGEAWYTELEMVASAYLSQPKV